jgi:hypothetical protein
MKLCIACLSRYRVGQLLLFYALLSAHTAADNKAVEKGATEVISRADENDNNYLYLGHHAVIEYLQESEENPESPSFIFGPSNGGRVLEFYTPWCSHVSISVVSRRTYNTFFH